MKTTSTLSKLLVISTALMFFNSCQKNEDNGLNNLMPYRNDASQTQTLDMREISSDMVLEDRVNGVDYTIVNNIQVNAQLTIKPGVTLMFKDGAGIQVNETGALTAIGADGNVILFTSESGKRGAWKGVTIQSNNARNVISYCKIEQGGATNNFGLGNIVIGRRQQAAQVEISHSEITASGADGIVIAEGSKVNGFNANKVHTNTGFPVSMHITDGMNVMDGNQFVNNGKEFIKVSGDGETLITKPILLKKINESFLVSGVVTAGNEFKIEAGSRVFMDSGAEIVIDGSTGTGSFSAVGTESSPIYIAATFNGNGLWNTIRLLSSNSDLNKIEYCTISGGGAGNTNANEGMISVINEDDGSSNITIRHSTIINSAATGIYIQGANSEYNSDIISGNIFSNNVKGNVHIE